MNNLKHTKGPWRISEKYSEHNNIVDKEGFEIIEIQYIQINENTPDTEHWSSWELAGPR